METESAPPVLILSRRSRLAVTAQATFAFCTELMLSSRRTARAPPLRSPQGFYRYSTPCAHTFAPATHTFATLHVATNSARRSCRVFVVLQSVVQLAVFCYWLSCMPHGVCLTLSDGQNCALLMRMRPALPVYRCICTQTVRPHVSQRRAVVACISLFTSPTAWRMSRGGATSKL